MSKKKIIICIIIFAIITIIAILLTNSVIGYIKDKKKKEENAKLVKEYYNNKFEMYKKENSQIYGVDVAFLGDSLTDGCDLEKYYTDYSVTNRGIGGDTTYGLKGRLKVSAYDVNPKVIVILIGGNDILSGKGLESIYNNYEEIITGIQNNLPDTKIVWCSLTALGGNWAKYNDTCIICNQKIKLLANKFGCTFVDLYTPLCNEKTDQIFENYTIEGVHLTDAGYKVISSKINQAITDNLSN